MADLSAEVYLPPSVEQMLHRICIERKQQPANVNARKHLARLDEQTSIQILTGILHASSIKTLSGYIVHMVKKHLAPASPTAGNAGFISPQKRPSPSSTPGSPDFRNNSSYRSPKAKPELFTPSPSSKSKTIARENIHQLRVLNELEFRKAFLVLSYVGRKKVEDVVDADDIASKGHLSMDKFEVHMWETYGQHYCDKSDRRKYLDWDNNNTYLYYCYVLLDGSYFFKGPYLDRTRTHLQRAVGDENVLIVKFEQEAKSNGMGIGSSNCNAIYSKIAMEGILVGLRRYQFFVFKDGGKEEKRGKKSKISTSSAVKCYFVRMQSIVSCNNGESDILSPEEVHKARRAFMHLHTVSSMAKYVARFSLILSKTIKLQVDLASVSVEDIEDILCRDEKGGVVYGEDGEKPAVHTDGTGFISEDLSMMCPKDFCSAKYIKDGNLQNIVDCVNPDEPGDMEACTRELPLLMQCRLFKNGCAVKGTLLVNKKLPPRTIQIRPLMIKVEEDETLGSSKCFNSLEIVAVSHKPKRAVLSKYLIALLSYGGVPKEYFLKLQAMALEEAQCVYTKKRAALRVAVNHGEIDDDYTVARMILSGIPLTEPFLKHRLSSMSSADRIGLKAGKLPISESFYLMGTADPTGVLKNDEVCVILEHGPISGDVLVYRNPGLHFGDIHKLKAVNVECLKEFVGNAKYAIFFSTKGPRSVANEIANGDFDGDMYWVSRNPELLRCFKPSQPWTRKYSTPSAPDCKPADFLPEQLEHAYFQQFLKAREPNYNMGVAAESWLAFMDRLLILGDGSAEEKECIKEKILHLIDTYYDALDAPKSGKKVRIQDHLKVELYPHHMGKENSSYRSTSVLGQIYDAVESPENGETSTQDLERLPSLEVEFPDELRRYWYEKYAEYRIEMSEVMNNEEDESRNELANGVIKKYKQLLYEAPEFEESSKNIEQIFNEALAIYHVTYDHAMKNGVKKCGFAWRVAGFALCKLHSMKQNERPITCLPSVLRELF